MLKAKLPHLAAWNAARRANAVHYEAELDGCADLVTPITDPANEHTYHQYTIRADRRDALVAALKADGIGCAVYYPKPMHLQPAYSRYGDGEGSLPVSEDLCRRILCLPMHAYMDDAIVERICNTVRDVVGV